jgi:hypothetical protein
MNGQWDDVVNAIMLATKCDRAKAEKVAQMNGHTPPAVTVAAERDARVLEKAEQQEVINVFTAFSFKCYNLSQARAAKQTPGLADLWCVHTELPIAFWWETKRQVGGEHSDAQLEFRDECVRCRVGYGTGDRFAARTHMIKLGLAHVVGQTLEPIRAQERSTCRV